MSLRWDCCRLRGRERGGERMRVLGAVRGAKAQRERVPVPGVLHDRPAGAENFSAKELRNFE